MYYINRHSVLVYCVTIFEFVPEQKFFPLKTCELNNVHSDCVPFSRVHTLPFVSPCTCQDVQDAALEMQSCFLVGVRFEFAPARQCQGAQQQPLLPSPAVLFAFCAWKRQ